VDNRITLALVLLLSACGGTADIDYAPHQAEAIPVLPGLLTWTTPIDDGVARFDAQAAIEGTTLHGIVSGEIPLVDGQGCTSCHYEGADIPYVIPVEQGGIYPIGSDDLIDGRKWKGPDGWAERFLNLPETMHDAGPGSLADALVRWQLHGELPCEPLTWKAPMGFRNLGYDPVEPLRGVSLDDIVSSRVIVRGDGLRCDECHFQGGEVSYRPDVSGPVPSDQEVDGYAWGGADGWAARFLEYDGEGPDAPETVKPEVLRAALAKWLTDGSRVGIDP
jgi:hypothetical protein